MNNLHTPQRPSTSSGELIEPRSELLRQALLEKRNLPQRAVSTTPRKARAGYKSQAYHDDWIPSSDDEEKPTRRNVRTRQLARRLTDTDISRSAVAPSPPATPTPGVGVREASAEITRLQKENWDLKHRICLQQERAKQLNEQLEAALEQLESSRDLRERNYILEQEKEKLKERISRRDEAITKLNENNKQLNEIQDELVQEMEQKDEELQKMEQEVSDRQLALEEAAGFIQQLELKVESLQQTLDQQKPTPADRQDSDYYSADPGGVEAVTPKPASIVAKAESTQDSDYFSASPNMTPKTPKDQNQPSGREEQRAKARVSALSFNKQVGLRSITSKDSLFGNFLESPALPKAQPSRILRRKPSRPRTAISEEGSTSNAESPSWSTSRPLRDLYKSGELGRGIGGERPVPLAQLLLSQASITSREIEDDIFSRGGTSRPSSPASTVRSELVKEPSIEQPNYDRWPRKLPEWPPSAGLAHRDILFHGEEEQKVTATTPPMKSPWRHTPSPKTVPPRQSSLRSK